VTRSVKFEYEVSWNGGRIHVQADTLAEVTKTIKQLRETNREVDVKDTHPAQVVSKFPSIPGTLGCSDAMQALLATEWGDTPRTEKELDEAMQFNGLHYTHGAISSTLVSLFRDKGLLRRPMKKNGAYAYVLAHKTETPENQDN
jgi:hypothetical protein